MGLNTRMTVTEAGRRIVRALIDHAAMLGTAIVGAALALALFSVLRAHEDHLIERLLDAEGRVIASEMTRSLDARTRAIAEFARRWEGVVDPQQAAWDLDATALTTLEPVFRAYEWRDTELASRWSTPLTARLPGAELDSTYESERITGMASALQQSGGVVSASFPGPGGQRMLVFSAPLVRDGTRLGIIAAVARAPDLIKAIVEPATRRGYSVAVREGPYHVFGPLASKEGEDAERWQHTVAVRAGELVWAVDYWPGGEVLDRLKSLGPPLVLLVGLFAAVIAAVMVRSLELARRARRVAASLPPSGAGVPGTLPGTTVPLP